MKIAFRSFDLSSSSFMVQCLGTSILTLAVSLPALAYGQTIAPATPVAVINSGPDSAPKVVMPPLPDSKSSLSDGAASVKGSENLSDAEDKVTHSAQDTIKRLEATDNITLEDLNSAHEMVAKIDVLIDIEKHMAELDKLRADHAGKSSMVSAIPINALRPPPASSAPSSFSPTSPMAVSYNSEAQVTRIIGSAGQYSAIVRTIDGQIKTVRFGDHIDGAKVVAINADSVEMESGGTHYTMHVKNVETVFGSAP